VRVDFYQLAEAPVEDITANIAGKLLEAGERLLVIASDKGFLAKLDRMLWDRGRTNFLPHALAGDGEDSRQPILLSTDPDPANRARNLLIADGEWREAALAFHRAFYLFGAETLEGARNAWRGLAGRDGVERHFWRQEGGRWVEQK
jgi:DNA polymerase-3 subunit chi